MSTIPSRSQSLRKPTAGTSLQAQKTSIITTTRLPTSSKPQDASAPTATSSSRLPVKPPAFGHSRTRSTATHNASTVSSIPPPRSLTSRPPISTTNKTKPRSLTLQTRTKTPDSLRSSTSISSPKSIVTERLPSTPTTPSASSAARHLRGSSVSSIVSNNARSQASPSRHARTTSHATFSASSLSRPLSVNGSTALRPPSHPTSQASNSATGGNANSRPTFSTLQQHFSPAKSLAPKQSTASFLIPPTPSKRPENIAITAEIARLQAELLQLHILHRQCISDNVLGRYSESARVKLGVKFEEARSERAEVREAEAEEGERACGEVLKEWKDNGVEGWGLEERVAVLDEVITGVWAMSDVGSRYSKCVRSFERWLEKTERLLESRRTGRPLDLATASLDQTWKDESARSLRKLSSWKADIMRLGQVEGPSALAETVAGCGLLVTGMLAEVQSMLRIEVEVARQEREWIARMCDEDSDSEGLVGRGVGGAWRG